MCFRFSLTSSVQFSAPTFIWGMYFSMPEGGVREIRIFRLLMYVYVSLRFHLFRKQRKILKLREKYPNDGSHVFAISEGTPL